MLCLCPLTTTRIMITALLPFLVVLALAWIWLSAARAREFATILARRHCEKRGLQFLDDTVAPVLSGAPNGGFCEWKIGVEI